VAVDAGEILQLIEISQPANLELGGFDRTFELCDCSGEIGRRIAPDFGGLAGVVTCRGRRRFATRAEHDHD
jgi:hypothetical protein